MNVKSTDRQSTDRSLESTDLSHLVACPGLVESTDFHPPGRSHRPTAFGVRMTPRKKLIEVALPLDAINKACAREKSIRHGHPSTLHLWWARRPLAEDIR